MRLRRASVGTLLLIAGCVVALLGSPDHGLNGWTLLGIALGITGLAFVYADPEA